MYGPVVDHVGIVVADLDAAVRRYSSLLAGTPVAFEDDEPLDCRWAHVQLPGSIPIELLAPRSERSPYHRHLQRRGEGLHHVSFRVTDLAAEPDRLRGEGVDVLGFSLDHSGWQELFVHPRHAHGVLLHFGVPPA